MTETGAGTGTAGPDAAALLRSRNYVALLLLGAVIGVPVAAAAYFYLKAVGEAQKFVFTTLPKDLGFAGEPAWWPLLPLALSGFVVALSIRHLPGTSGHKPAEGFKTGSRVEPADLYGILLASLATLCLGAVLGPEAPLIALGGGLGTLAVHLLKRDAPATATAVIGAAGSFAAVATLLGSPLTGAFLIMEAAGLSGPMLGVILVPGLLASGIGALIFVGLDRWTGYGTFSLAIPHIPSFTTPDAAEFLWAVVIGLVAAFLGSGIRRLALLLQPRVERRILLLTPAAGLAVAGCAVAFGEATGHSSSEVLFSGQSALPALVQNAAGWTVGALVLVVLFKGLAYGISLSCFRGGPVFPSLFIGAAGGIALSHLPGLPMIAGVGMGIGAMAVAMLRLPLTSVLLASLLLASDALALMPLVIVAVVVAYVTVARLAPAATAQPDADRTAKPTTA
ncbi:chloride channel protein [Streptacidiphilus neutrinimicus]|uniref:chloride channel protein n=1 Tax=Streptacidiphilus neutrinimicus TaxID=105420 RepID=UPI0005A776C3|nr:chloride channel protein [Streptacidiphilus neutrinimicus]